MHGHGLEVQDRAIRAFAQSQGYDLIDVISDPGASGARPPGDRPGFRCVLELAEDRTNVLRDSAMAILQRATLSPASTTEEFRSWWEKNSNDFGEDQKRARVESAAKILLRGEDTLDRRMAIDIIRAAPGGIALAPLPVDQACRPSGWRRAGARPLESYALRPGIEHRRS